MKKKALITVLVFLLLVLSVGCSKKNEESVTVQKITIKVMETFDLFKNLPKGINAKDIEGWQTNDDTVVSFIDNLAYGAKEGQCIISAVTKSGTVEVYDATVKKDTSEIQVTGNNTSSETTQNKTLTPGFSVSPTQKVEFSKGNLYATNGGSFAFEEHQYDASRWEENHVGYFWYSPDIETAKAVLFDTDSLSFDEKGILFSDGSLTVNGEKWRVLSSNEWYYLLGGVGDASVEYTGSQYYFQPEPGVTCRTASTINGVENARFVVATVEDRNGLIIFPDDFEWNEKTMGPLPEYINDFVPSIGTNKYTIKEFEAQEEKGIIFLPNNGYRDTEYNRQTKTRDVVYRYDNENGYYWTSTPYSYEMSLAVKTTQCAFVTTWLVYRGFSIRLVKDIK